MPVNVLSEVVSLGLGLSEIGKRFSGSGQSGPVRQLVNQRRRRCSSSSSSDRIGSGRVQYAVFRSSGIGSAIRAVEVALYVRFGDTAFGGGGIRAVRWKAQQNPSIRR